MRQTLSYFVILAVIGLTMSSAAQQIPASTTTTPTMTPASPPTKTTEDMLIDLRSDLQGDRAEIIAKNVTLTSEQASKFWPLYDRYQKEQNAIMDAQLKSVQQYAEHADTLDDAGALALMKAHLDRDAQMQQLREKWLPEFQKVLPTKLAVRVIQIDRRLSMAHQMAISWQIPLVH